MVVRPPAPQKNSVMSSKKRLLRYYLTSGSLRGA